MDNSYIVDTFLSGMVWAILVYLFFDSRARIAELNEVMDVTVLSLALANVVKKASFVALPFALFFVFLLGRFYGLMVVSRSWGAGGAGLLAAMFAAGVALIWLQSVLVFVRNSGFAVLSKKINDGRQVARRQ